MGVDITIPSYQYRNSRCGEKMLRPSYLYKRISYTDKTSLYWIWTRYAPIFNKPWQHGHAIYMTDSNIRNSISHEHHEVFSDKLIKIVTLADHISISVAMRHFMNLRNESFKSKIKRDFVYGIMTFVVNTLKPKVNGRSPADDIFEWVSLTESGCILIQISLNFLICS